LAADWNLTRRQEELASILLELSVYVGLNLHVTLSDARREKEKEIGDYFHPSVDNEEWVIIKVVICT
jgi:hypothetical protein